MKKREKKSTKLHFPIEFLGSARKWIFLFIGFIAVLNVSAQKNVVTGTVVDAKNEPLIGVSVKIKGTTNGTMTNFDGKFSIDASATDVLVISYVGTTTQEILVGSSKNINVTLQDDSKVLDEVVVVGYGTVKRKDVTTAVSSVSAKDFDTRPIVSAGQALQGKAAGVQVIQPNGAPGGETVIRVRGTTSLNGSSEPLYVVDGVPVDNMSFLSPNDIENINILKDASSAAI